MTTYSVADAKAGLPRLIDRALEGEELASRPPCRRAPSPNWPPAAYAQHDPERYGQYLLHDLAVRARSSRRRVWRLGSRSAPPPAPSNSAASLVPTPAPVPT
jgi:hypothetical protein